MAIPGRILENKPLVEGSGENYTDEELIGRMLKIDTFIQMHPVKEYKVHLKLLSAENAKPRKIALQDF